MTKKSNQAHLCALDTERAATAKITYTHCGDSSGHIQGRGIPSCFKVFLKAGKDIIRALAVLSIGVDTSPGVLTGCERFCV